MKNIILTIFIFLLALTVNAQTQYYPFEAGQYVIFNVGAGDTITVDRREDAPGVHSYRNHIEVVDTIWKVPGETNLDTLLNFTRPEGKRAAIGFERGGEYTGTIIVADDSLVFFAHGSGADAIVAGYINPFEYSVTVRDLAITDTMTAMFIEEETFYMVTEEGEIMVEEY
jgi:hypothetical protein